MEMFGRVLCKLLPAGTRPLILNSLTLNEGRKCERAGTCYSGGNFARKRKSVHINT